MAAALAVHDATLTRVIEANGGRVFKGGHHFRVLYPVLSEPRRTSHLGTTD
jgi:hypothetical protein